MVYSNYSLSLFLCNFGRITPKFYLSNLYSICFMKFFKKICVFQRTIFIFYFDTLEVLSGFYCSFLATGLCRGFSEFQYLIFFFYYFSYNSWLVFAYESESIFFLVLNNELIHASKIELRYF